MILATQFTFIVEKTYTFTQKWLDHLLLMTSYLVTIAMTIAELVSKCVRGMNKPLLKTSGADVLSLEDHLQFKTALPTVRY